MGVTIGDNVKQAISEIQKYGFELKETDNDYFTVTLRYKDFTIKIEPNIDTLGYEEDNFTNGSITLSAESKYLGNREY